MRLNRLRRTVAAKKPQTGNICSDNGTFLDWMVGRFWTVVKHAEEVESALDEINAARNDLEIRINELRHEQERIGLIPEALDVLGRIGNKEDLISLLELVKSSGMSPFDLACTLKRENFPNVLAWVRQLNESLAQKAEAVSELSEKVTALKKALDALEQKGAELERDIKVKMHDLERAHAAVAAACGIARDVGLYVDYIKQTCETNKARTVQELMLEPALVVAGVILEAAATAYGDKEITLMPGPRHPLPMQVTVREIARSLAPPEAYRAQQEAEMRMRVKAETITAG